MLETEASYGSDKHGLVWAYAFRPGSPPVAIDAERVASWLAVPAHAAGGEFLWLHFSLSNAATERSLRAWLPLPDAFYRSFSEQASSTTVEQDGESLVAVLHDARFEFAFEPESVATVSLCLARQLFVTARLQPVRSIDRLRAGVRGGDEVRSPPDLLAQLLRHQADVLVSIIRDSTRKVDGVEDQLLANRVAVSRRELGAVRRTLVRLQRLLAPEPAALFRLLNRSPTWIAMEDVQELRQAAEEFATALADSAALIERVRLLQEELAALVGEQTNRTLFVLTVVTVLALPVNLVAGLFGMNVGGIPFSTHGQGFFVIVTVLALFTAVAAYLALWRRRSD